MFYVYEWFIIDTQEVIYVGKGTGLRYKVRKHNKFFNEFIRRFNCDSRIIKEFENEEDAFAFEFDRINELKKIGQCICNIRDGGFGGETNWWTEKLRDSYSKNNVMKSTAQRKRMSENNPMKNKDISEKVNSKKRIAVIVDGVEFPSVKSVMEHYSVSASTVNNWCIKGVSPDGKKCYYKHCPHGIRYATSTSNQNKQIIYKGERYNSTSDFAQRIGVSQTTASRWCRQGRDSYGNPCRYESDTDFVESGISQKQIPVIINGVWYPSKEKAARETGISSYKITCYLKGKAIDKEFVCEYGNQQPSRENTDNSIPEGSETNR